MEKIFDKTLYLLRRSFLTTINKNHYWKFTDKNAQLKGQSASNLIFERILENKPLMVGRIGSGELGYILENIQSNLGPKKYFKYICGQIESYKITSKSIHSAFNNGGIFPANKEVLSKFAELMLNDFKELDILGTWIDKEDYLKNELNHTVKIKLNDIEPYYHEKPWTIALKNKNILVIHPFKDSIEAQYLKRDLLFENKNILPEFNLKTIKAVQSIAGEKTRFKNWFEALDYMKSQINKTEFDLAIIGCGAYGFPLAAHVKRIGKQVIHMGGATQLLFGIKGKRWDNHKFISKLYNEYWINPSSEETPKNCLRVENGCYW